MPDTHTVTVVDMDQSVTATEGQTILAALLDAGIEWMHACGMQCACTTCAVIVEQGEEHLSDMQDEERKTLKRFRGPTVFEENTRLSCQATVHGDVIISKPDWT